MLTEQVLNNVCELIGVPGSEQRSQRSRVDCVSNTRPGWGAEGTSVEALAPTIDDIAQGGMIMSALYPLPAEARSSLVTPINTQSIQSATGVPMITCPAAVSDMEHVSLFKN